MPFIINGQVIKSSEDYLSKGSRGRLNLSIRNDLKVDTINLSKHIDKPISVMFDVWIEMLQADEDLLNKFITRVKKY